MISVRHIHTIDDTHAHKNGCLQREYPGHAHAGAGAEKVRSKKVLIKQPAVVLSNIICEKNPKYLSKSKIRLTSYVLSTRSLILEYKYQ